MAAFTSNAKVRAMVESIVPKRIASRLPLGSPFEVARLHQRRVQIEVVRHYGRTQDADGDIQHAGIEDDLRRRDKESLARCPAGLAGKINFQTEADPDHPDQGNHQCLDQAKPFLLQK